MLWIIHEHTCISEAPDLRQHLEHRRNLYRVLRFCQEEARAHRLTSRVLIISVVMFVFSGWEAWRNSGCSHFCILENILYRQRLPNIQNHAADHIDPIGFGILQELSKMGEGTINLQLLIL